MKRNTSFTFVAIGLICLFTGLVSSQTLNDKTDIPKTANPPEFQFSDAEVKGYVDAALASGLAGNEEALTQQLQRALILCEEKNLVSDKSLVEGVIAVRYISQGNLEQAKKYFHDSLSDAVKASNLVVQADDLVSLASLSQGSGDASESLSLLTKALELARNSQSAYIQSRVLGELGRIQLALGKTDEANRSLKEALQIDQESNLPWKANHLIYLAWLAQSGPNPNIDETIKDATEDPTIQKMRSVLPP